MLRLSTVFSLLRRTLCVRSEEMSKKGSFFYAVRKGHRPGVYKSWDECQFQVDKFPAARYKKFASEDEAWDFVRNETTSTESNYESLLKPFCLVQVFLLALRGPLTMMRVMLGRAKNEPNMSLLSMMRLKDSLAWVTNLTFILRDAVVVYTDGCCTNNGRHGARAGIGVYWGPDHPLNVAERLSGRQTNQRAELQAACRALEQARDMDIKKLVLYTDSKFTINGITSWVKNWKTNGWKLRTGGEVVNKEDFQQLDELNEELDVKWMHVPGHAGYLGNEEADRLSREGASK
ncbi:ribonuclease H1 isoform 1, partial [Silurus asotus]